MTHHELVKYSMPARVLHWVHTGAFIVLFLTGLILFVPPLAFLAEGSWTRIIHRIAAIIFIAAPLIYLIRFPRGAWHEVKEAFNWGSEDMGWLQAAPKYYFLGDEKGMPPQGAMNTGQKLWWLMVLLFGVLFVITGAVMCFANTTAPSAVLLWMVFLHDVSFITTGAMLFVHIYLGVFHPMMTEAWRSMTEGKVSAEYARSHHLKWYEQAMRGKSRQAE